MPQTISSIHDSLKAGKNSKPPEDNRVTQPSETASIVPKKMDDNTDGDSFKLADKNEQASVQDEVWLFDNIAFRPTPETPWRTEFVLAFFKENNVIREKITATIAELAQLFKLAPDDETTEKRIRERVAPFIRQIGQCMEAAVKYQQGGQLHLGPSNDSGIVSVEMPVPVPLDIRWDAEGHAPKPGDSRLMSIVNKENEGSPRHPATAGLETGKAFFAQDGGWGVISDIDDTIKVTEVRDRIKLLKNTFVNVPTPVEGMPDLYQQLHEAISTPKHPAPFIYLSASPYNLYPMLRGFVRSMFPEGMLILRDMSWMDMDAFVVTLTRGTQEYKDNRIRKVANWLPRTTWVCIGDSTQTDPEVYAEFYTRLAKDNQGGRIARIWIHKVVGVNPSKEKSLNAPKRFEKAFESVPKNVWRLFENASELQGEIEVLRKEVAMTSRN